VAKIDSDAGEWWALDLATEHLDRFRVQIRLFVEGGPYTVSLDMTTGEARWRDRDGQIIHSDTVPLPELPELPDQPGRPELGSELTGLEALPDYDGPVLEGEIDEA
jgi:hypothetical protein